MEKKIEEKPRDLLVVAELPRQPVKIGSDGDGKEYDLYTIEEAMTEMLKLLRQIQKGLLGK